MEKSRAIWALQYCAEDREGTRKQVGLTLILSFNRLPLEFGNNISRLASGGAVVLKRIQNQLHKG